MRFYRDIKLHHLSFPIFDETREEWGAFSNLFYHNYYLYYY